MDGYTEKAMREVPQKNLGTSREREEFAKEAE